MPRKIVEKNPGTLNNSGKSLSSKNVKKFKERDKEEDKKKQRKTEWMTTTKTEREKTEV